MIQYVVEDAIKLGKKVTYIESPEMLPHGALLVACKLEPGTSDFHFAVQLPNGVWIDKPGRNESRYGKIDGFGKI